MFEQESIVNGLDFDSFGFGLDDYSFEGEWGTKSKTSTDKTMKPLEVALKVVKVIIWVKLTNKLIKELKG